MRSPLRLLTSILQARIVPATGSRWLLQWYDPLVKRFTQEQRFKRHLLESAKLEAGTQVLDVGCGSGTLTLALARREPLASVRGVDADRRILSQAARKTRPEDSIQWSLGNATHLPFDDASMDLVTCSLLLHHLTATEKRRAVSEIFRVLEPGGRLLLADFCRPNSRLARVRFLLVRIIDGWERTRCNAAGELPKLLQQVGLLHVRETLVLDSALGTIRCYEAQRGPRSSSGRERLPPNQSQEPKRSSAGASALPFGARVLDSAVGTIRCYEAQRGPR